MWSNISKHGWQQLLRTPAVRIYEGADYADYAADMENDSIFSTASDMETDSIFFAVFTVLFFQSRVCGLSKEGFGF